MTDYTAPRRFSSPPTAQELERLAEDVANLYRFGQFALALKPRLGVARENVTLGLGELVRIDTDSSFMPLLRAFLPDVKRPGMLGILRLSSLGLISVRPTNCTVDGATSVTLATSVKAYLFLSDGKNWYSV